MPINEIYRTYEPPPHPEWHDEELPDPEYFRVETNKIYGAAEYRTILRRHSPLLSSKAEGAQLHYPYLRSKIDLVTLPIAELNPISLYVLGDHLEAIKEIAHLFLHRSLQIDIFHLPPYATIIPYWFKGKLFILTPPIVEISEEDDWQKIVLDGLHRVSVARELGYPDMNVMLARNVAVPNFAEVVRWDEVQTFDELPKGFIKRKYRYANPEMVQKWLEENPRRFAQGYEKPADREARISTQQILSQRPQYQRHHGLEWKSAISSTAAALVVWRYAVQKFASAKEYTKRVADETRHGQDVLGWALKIDPNASDELQIAAYLHDIERILRPERSQSTKIDHNSVEYLRYKEEHAQYGANYVTGHLNTQVMNQRSIDRIHFLIAHHDDHDVDHWNDQELSILASADTLSFFSSIAPDYLARKGESEFRGKLRLMIGKMPEQLRHLLIETDFREAGIEAPPEIVETIDRIKREVIHELAHGSPAKITEDVR